MAELFEILLPLGAAFLLGGVIGLERELRRQAAGLRTHVLAAAGSAVFVLAVASAPGVQATEVGRVIQGVAAGIGFIGAGTILQQKDLGQVKGLTTAASIWLAAAVGTACALQRYVLATTATMGALLVLVLLQLFEAKVLGTGGPGAPGGEQNAPGDQRPEQSK